MSCHYLLLLTSAFLHKIRVVIFFVKPTLFNDELKSIIHQTSITSTIEWCVTINKFLFRQRSQISFNYLVYALNCCNRRKCPTTTCIYIISLVKRMFVNFRIIRKSLSITNLTLSVNFVLFTLLYPMISYHVSYDIVIYSSALNINR